MSERVCKHCGAEIRPNMTGTFWFSRDDKVDCAVAYKQVHEPAPAAPARAAEPTTTECCPEVTTLHFGDHISDSPLPQIWISSDADPFEGTAKLSIADIDPLIQQLLKEKARHVHQAGKMRCSIHLDALPCVMCAYLSFTPAATEPSVAEPRKVTDEELAPFYEWHHTRHEPGYKEGRKMADTFGVIARRLRFLEAEHAKQSPVPPSSPERERAQDTLWRVVEQHHHGKPLGVFGVAYGQTYWWMGCPREVCERIVAAVNDEAYFQEFRNDAANLYCENACAAHNLAALEARLKDAERLLGDGSVDGMTVSERANWKIDVRAFLAESRR